MESNDKSLKIAILILIGIILLFLGIFFYAQNHWSVNNGEFGDLLAGTIGVAVNIGAITFIIINLREQQKMLKEQQRMSKQVEIHHLVDNFNMILDRLIDLSNHSYSNSNNSSIPIKSYISDLQNKIKETLNKVTGKIREQTVSNLYELEEWSKDDDLAQLSRTLNRLLSIRLKIEELDKEALSRVNHDWASIPSTWKFCAGFYLSWNYETSESTAKEKFYNELIEKFLDKNEPHVRLSYFIPRIKIYTGNEYQFQVNNKHDFAKQEIIIDSINNSEIKITQVSLRPKNERDSRAFLFNEPKIQKEGNVTYTFKDFFGPNTDDVFNYILSCARKSIQEKPFKIYQDIYLKYHEKEWKYENEIECMYYENNKASIIFKEIEDNE